MSLQVGNVVDTILDVPDFEGEKKKIFRTFKA